MESSEACLQSLQESVSSHVIETARAEILKGKLSRNREKISDRKMGVHSL